MSKLEVDIFSPAQFDYYSDRIGEFNEPRYSINTHTDDQRIATPIIGRNSLYDHNGYDNHLDNVTHDHYGHHAIHDGDGNQIYQLNEDESHAYDTYLRYECREHDHVTNDDTQTSFMTDTSSYLKPQTQIKRYIPLSIFKAEHFYKFNVSCPCYNKHTDTCSEECHNNHMKTNPNTQRTPKCMGNTSSYYVLKGSIPESELRMFDNMSLLCDVCGFQDSIINHDMMTPFKQLVEGFNIYTEKRVMRLWHAAHEHMTFQTHIDEWFFSNRGPLTRDDVINELPPPFCYDPKSFDNTAKFELMRKDASREDALHAFKEYNEVCDEFDNFLKEVNKNDHPTLDHFLGVDRF